MPELVINVSSIISSLCYSLIRVEPFTTCPHGCLYCYARWYRRSDSSIVKPRAIALKEFKRFAQIVYRKGVKPIPARLSTLVDPFPPHEELYLFTLKVLEVALDLEYPLIVNTKSVIIARDPWRKALLELGNRGLLVLQMSIPCIDSSYARRIEPAVASPLERLRVLKIFSDAGVPTIVRLSPFIPSVSLRPSPHEVAATLKEYGVHQVIVESIRVEHDRNDLIELLGLKGTELEGYSLREISGLKPVVRPALRVRVNAYKLLANALRKEGIKFAICKEGMYRLWTANNCCGMDMLRTDIVYRVTLREVYDVVMRMGGRARVEDVIKAIEKYDNRYLFGNKWKCYPYPVSKMMRYHDKRLLRTLRDRQLLSHVCPDLYIEDDFIIINNTYLAVASRATDKVPSFAEERR